MEFLIYILYSKKLQKYYAGHTDNITERLLEHNRGKGNFTSKGIPWDLVVTFPAATRAEAMKLELQIKKRGTKRYLNDRNVL